MRSAMCRVMCSHPRGLRGALDALSLVGPGLLCDGDTLSGLLVEASRVEALVCREVAAFDRGGEWNAVGAQNAAAWVTTRARCDRRLARRRLRLGRSLRWMDVGRRGVRGGRDRCRACRGVGAGPGSQQGDGVGVRVAIRRCWSGGRRRRSSIASPAKSSCGCSRSDADGARQSRGEAGGGAPVPHVAVVRERMVRGRGVRPDQRSDRPRRVGPHRGRTVRSGLGRGASVVGSRAVGGRTGPHRGAAARRRVGRDGPPAQKPPPKTGDAPCRCSRCWSAPTRSPARASWRRARSSRRVTLAGWLTEAMIERVVFDGPDRVQAVGHQRAFTGALRRAIEVRDRTRACQVFCVRSSWLLVRSGR